MSTLEEMGKKAYQKQMWGAYEDAVALYSEALQRYPNDSRLFNNRCMCFIELKEYSRAMDDAENMILLFKNKKAYFRKGEILLNLKQYSEAEEAFKQVLKLDSNCEDTQRQLFEVQCLELCRRGKYPKKKVVQAMQMSNTIEEADRLIKSGKLDMINKELEDIIYFSDEESANGSDSETNPQMDPSNPFSCTTLWVGNITKDVTEQTLKTLFGKHGRIKSLKLLTQYAFINYFDATGPGKAMKALQGSQVGGKNLIIKYPDNASSLVKKVVKSK